jgi:uncharacterized protein YkuJ
MVSSQVYHDDIKVCTIEWSWENQVNDFQILDRNKDYRYDLSYFEKNGKYLGTVSLSIDKQPVWE